MATKINNVRMLDYEASKQYPDNYILLRMDDFVSDMCTVLYTSTDRNELYSIMNKLENQSFCGIMEGANLCRDDLGGYLI